MIENYTIDDARLVLNAAQGPDERDIQSIGTPLALDGPQPGSIKGMRLALNIDLGCYAVDPEVEAAVREAARALADCGAAVDCSIFNHECSAFGTIPCGKAYSFSR